METQIAVLVWIDSFEKFYQMPLPIWREFKKTPLFDKLENMGYSDYCSENNGDGIHKDLEFSDLETNELPSMEMDLSKEL